MKLQLEEIAESAHSSFRILVNPKLSDFFFWHFHPELELVYIEGVDGTRHVGEHMSSYTGSDLVFIGSNIPHLNFDYGVKGSYSHSVLHLRPDFLTTSFDAIPELKNIKLLFQQAQYVLSFSPKVKHMVGQRMKGLHQLDRFQQLLEILSIFNILAADSGKRPLHFKPIKNLHGRRDQQRLALIYHYIEKHYQSKIDLARVADISNLSREAFCRYFKKMTRLTFTEFVNHYRIETAKRLLMQGASITETCFECGYESISYFNRTFKKIIGINPTAFKKQFFVGIERKYK